MKPEVCYCFNAKLFFNLQHHFCIRILAKWTLRQQKSRKNRKISLSLELNICYTHLINAFDASKRLFTVGRHAPSRQTVMWLLANINQSNCFLCMYYTTFDIVEWFFFFCVVYFFYLSHSTIPLYWVAKYICDYTFFDDLTMLSEEDPRTQCK